MLCSSLLHISNLIHRFLVSCIISDPVASSTSHPVMTNNQQQIFSDFSASTRAVIGSCLATIQCLQTQGDCGQLFQLCHTQGPGALPSDGDVLERVAMSEHSVECRIENILCHVKQDENCQEQYQDCRSQEPDSRNNVEQDSFNAMGEYLFTYLFQHDSLLIYSNMTHYQLHNDDP